MQWTYCAPCDRGLCTRELQLLLQDRDAQVIVPLLLLEHRDRASRGRLRMEVLELLEPSELLLERTLLVLTTSDTSNRRV